MITAAAVEAGAEALNCGFILRWEVLPVWIQDDLRAQARRVLEAAEPHLQAGK